MSRALFALALFTAPLTAAAAPMALSNQGYLADANGDGLIGSHDLTFSIYDDAAATNPALWSETLTVDFTEGAYSVILGDTTAIDDALLEQYPLYLGLSVDGGGDMIPRHEIVSVPYAILSETSHNVDGGTVEASSVTVGDTVIDSSGITIDGTTVIDSSGGINGSADLGDQGCTDGQHLTWDDASSDWICSAEADPGFAGSIASQIDLVDVAAWDDAVLWGDHGTEGYLTTESDPDFAASDAATITSGDINSWTTAAGWGDHSTEGYLTTESDPDFAASDAATITSGDISSWTTAAGWGDHSLVGYLTSFTELDPVFSASAAFGISASDITDWTDTFSFWGTTGTLNADITLSGPQRNLNIVNSGVEGDAGIIFTDGDASLPDIQEAQIVFDAGPENLDFYNEGALGMSLRNNGNVHIANELDIGGNAFAGISMEAVVNQGSSSNTTKNNIQTTVLGADNGRRMCFLQRMSTFDEYVNNSRGECNVYSDGTDWILEAHATDGDNTGDGVDIECRAQCLTW